ncbi:glycyl-radical enzyme activating protein [Candidatus Poribacteria bacterium]|jgi:glycyl-radical enzyme activating protein|nr:glycyl-radical enzyme activating protein [Candidatus Poribacteria bacterium]MBT5532990.1 glycyl-radical enzyme activating protein [Candidatus Poribacteria bacterium]MBT5715234.1 glycyl-radical enzyme activating protein [Candidatus Poribacteria bacterium]MBT7805484.1 glycyl-radical enzyme activating protein [Candidatus Poribacteria bacterium]
MSERVTGRIFDIKRFAVHDGPGVRTTFFLKGCPLRCAWCHNPESMSRDVELAFYPDKCIACGACVDACPQGAQDRSGAGEGGYLREACDLTGSCVDVCYAEALVTHGRDLTVEDAMAQALLDLAFYEESGGGVTLSGGEPLAQVEFVRAMLQACAAAEIHTALDTSGQVAWGAFESVLPWVNLVLYDLKHIDSERHREYTGASNERILENLWKLGQLDIPIEVRMPIVPGLNDDPEAIEGAARLLSEVENVVAVRLLPYHRLAGEKYRSLGRVNTMPEAPSPTREGMEDIANRLRLRGLRVIVPEEGARA